MLILERKPDQEIVCSNGLRIRVLTIRGDRVKLGFEGADDVRILRAEWTEPHEAEVERGSVAE